jgi:hypothetical protein
MTDIYFDADVQIDWWLWAFILDVQLCSLWSFFESICAEIFDNSIKN